MFFKKASIFIPSIFLFSSMLYANNCPKYLTMPYVNALHIILPIYDITITKTDTDCDEIIDTLDDDIDNDGLSNSVEEDLGTNPYKVDTDGDGVNDKEDIFPLDKTESADRDNDGIGDNADYDYNRTIKYVEDATLNSLNPDRGLYDADYSLGKDTDENMFEEVRANGYSLVYAPLNLEDYVTTDTLEESFLDTIEKNLQDANSSGVKLIFRIKYRDDMESDDATKDIVVSHLDQLKSLLQSYKEVISVVQAGTIGAWGEWHSFTGDYDDENEDYIENRKEVIDTLHEMLPQKYIQIRTPMHKELLYGESTEYAEEGDEGMITQEIAFTDDIRAKIGHHNDCVLSSATDTGTYPSDNIDFWKAYVENDAHYAPVGGETCGIGEDDDENLSSCPNALHEFRALHYSFLNDAYHPDVIDKWKEQGCYAEIRDNLGYRFVAKELNVDQNKTNLTLNLRLENKGFAAPFVEVNTTMVLKNDSHTYRFVQPIDMRKFESGIKNLKEIIDVADIEAGTYCLELEMKEGDFGMRVTNSDVFWQSQLQSNLMVCDIIVR